MKSKNSKFPSPSDREGALNALRNHKMARSVHTFVRGSTDKFYAWLEDMENDAIPRGPAIWIGGDCHIGNLGLWALYWVKSRCRSGTWTKQ
jgi:uncharacterized protein (DUF2252 family)